MDSVQCEIFYVVRVHSCDGSLYRSVVVCSSAQVWWVFLFLRERYCYAQVRWLFVDSSVMGLCVCMCFRCHCAYLRWLFLRTCMAVICVGENSIASWIRKHEFILSETKCKQGGSVGVQHFLPTKLNRSAREPS